MKIKDTIPVWGTEGPLNSQSTTIGPREISGTNWGVDKNLTFERDPLCYEEGPACPDIDNGKRFLRVEGTAMKIKDISIRGFYEGIHLAGKDATIENVHFDRMCDDAVSTINGVGSGSVLTESAITSGCDKCIQLNKGGSTTYDPGLTPRPGPCALPTSPTGTPPNRGCYHLSVLNTDFIGCEKPIEIAKGADQGDQARFYLQGVNISELSTDKIFSTTSLFACSSGVTAKGDNVVGDIVGLTSIGCDNGLSLAGLDSKYVVQGETLIEKSDLRGVFSFGSGTTNTLMSKTVVYDNGGWDQTSPMGGVTVTEGARISFNSGSNKICCNKAKPNSGVTSREVHNNSNLDIDARNNYWCGTSTPATFTNCTDPLNCKTITTPVLGSDPLPGISTPATCSSRTSRP